jgi:membrane associated rhomboid family serine protease
MQPRQAQFDTSDIFTRPPQGTLALMIATGVASVVAMASAGAFGTGGLARLLLFSPSSVLDEWRIWTPFTYLFVTFSPLSLLLYETFGLWMFGGALERLWGTRRFLYYFFATGTGAALLATLVGAFAPAMRLAPGFAFDGTSVALEATLLGWVLMNWHATAFLFFFPVRAPWLLVPGLVLPVLGIIQGAWQPAIPLLGGMGIGYLLLKKGLSPRRTLLRIRGWWIERQLKRRSRHLRVVRREDDDQQPPRYLN